MATLTDSLSFNIEVVSNGQVVRQYESKDGVDISKTTLYEDYRTYSMISDIEEVIRQFRVKPESVVEVAPQDQELPADDDVPL